MRKLVEFNDPPTTNLVYNVPLDSGILVVAFPDKENEDSDFAFDYWIDGAPAGANELALAENEDSNNSSASNSTVKESEAEDEFPLLPVIIGGVGGLGLLICMFATCYWYNNIYKRNIKVAQDGNH